MTYEAIASITSQVHSRAKGLLSLDMEPRSINSGKRLEKGLEVEQSSKKSQGQITEFKAKVNFKVKVKLLSSKSKSTTMPRPSYRAQSQDKSQTSGRATKLKAEMKNKAKIELPSSMPK